MFQDSANTVEMCALDNPWYTLQNIKATDHNPDVNLWFSMFHKGHWSPKAITKLPQMNFFNQRCPFLILRSTFYFGQFISVQENIIAYHTKVKNFLLRNFPEAVLQLWNTLGDFAAALNIKRPTEQNFEGVLALIKIDTPLTHFSILKKQQQPN